MEDIYYMRLCSKCKIDKQDADFATYYHSTQKKERTRKVCNSCFKEQKRLYRDSIKKQKITQPEVLKEEMEVQQVIFPIPEPTIIVKPRDGYKICRLCCAEKPSELFYKTQGHCKECESARERKRKLDIKIENGGSLKVGTYPNSYFDEYQKENTFNLMERMGWTFNEENNIWWKDGIKDKNGVFIKITSLYKKRVNKYTLEEMLELKQMRDSGMTFQQIQKEKRLAPGTLIKILNRLENEK